LYVTYFDFIFSEILFFLQTEGGSPVSSQSEVSNSAAASPVVCSSDEASHDSSLRETVKPNVAETFVLPGDIEECLDDTDSDCSLDVSGVSEEEFLQIHNKITEQRNLYRRKCVQVINFKSLKPTYMPKPFSILLVLFKYDTIRYEML